MQSTTSGTANQHSVCVHSFTTILQVPSNGPPGFPDDYTLVDHTPSPSVCQQCDDNNKPVAFCETCSDYLCEECLTAHTRLKAVRHHKTITLTPGEDLATQTRSKKTYYCSAHHEEVLKLYCNDCKSLACILCFVSKHNRHDTGSIDAKARKEMEESVTDMVKEADSKLKEFEDNLKYIIGTEKEKAAVSTSLKAQVNETVDKLIKQLETRREELLKEIDDTFTENLKKLWEDKELHETAITNMQGALSFARRSLACQEDTEVLALCAQVSSRLNELSLLTWDCTDTETIKETKVEFIETNTQVQSVSLVGELQLTVAKPVIEITTDKPQYRATFNEECAIQVKAVMKINGKTSLRHPQLNLTAVETGYDEVLNVIENPEPNSWTVIFTPKNYYNEYNMEYDIDITVRARTMDQTISCYVDVYWEEFEWNDEDMEHIGIP